MSNPSNMRARTTSSSIIIPLPPHTLPHSFQKTLPVTLSHTFPLLPSHFLSHTFSLTHLPTILHSSILSGSSAGMLLL